MLRRIKFPSFAHKKGFDPSSYTIAFVSPYVLAIVIFSILYIRLCSNDSNLDGDEYFSQGNYEKALECYNEYLMLYPHHIKTLYNRGRCYDELGLFKNACLDYEEVLDRDPHNVKAHLSLSQFYYREGNYEAAMNLSSFAAKLDEENYLAHYFLARSCHKLGLVSDALEAYNNTIGINPDFGFAYFQRSSILISVGLRPFGCNDLKIAANLDVEGAEEALQKFCQ